MTGILSLWFVLVAVGAPLHQTFPPPAHSKRVGSNAFGTWLGELDVQPPEVPVLTHDGRTVPHNARVIDLPLVRGDLQQCADSAIRLRAKWLRANHLPVQFHATSGDLLDWQRYRDGARPHEVSGRIEWRPAPPGHWESYLRSVFMWAGTRSLAAYDTISADSPRPGDLMIEPGSPGHAIVLMDVARSPDGTTFVLVGEGYMPAQSFHIELGPHDGWWRWTDGVRLEHWALPASTLRRWPEHEQ